MQNYWYSIIFESNPILQGVLAILIVGSVTVWSLLFAKWRGLSIVRKQNENFLNLFNKASSFSDLIDNSEKIPNYGAYSIFKVSYPEFLKLKDNYETYYKDGNLNFFLRNELLEIMERLIDSAIVNETQPLKWGQTFLATASVIAPFIGLFGTLIGIIDAFQNISDLKSVEISVVAPGISEALVATAAGLFTAIPASIGYNHFKSNIQEIIESMEKFGLKLLNQWHLELLKSYETPKV